MEYYDLIDTLITIPHNKKNLSGYINALNEAQTKYQPRGSFKIITSQPAIATGRIRRLVTARFPNCLDVIIVANTKGKIRALEAQRATNYTDNDQAVRRAIKKDLPNIQLHTITNGVRKPAND